MTDETLPVKVNERAFVSTVTNKLNKNAYAYVAYCARSAQFVKNCGIIAGQTWTKQGYPPLISQRYVSPFFLEIDAENRTKIS